MRQNMSPGNPLTGHWRSLFSGWSGSLALIAFVFLVVVISLASPPPQAGAQQIIGPQLSLQPEDAAPLSELLPSEQTPNPGSVVVASIAACSPFYDWAFSGRVTDALTNPLQGAKVAIYGSADANSQGTLAAGPATTNSSGYFSLSVNSCTDSPYQNLIVTAPASGRVHYDAQVGSGSNCTLTKKASNWIQNASVGGFVNCSNNTFVEVVPSPTPTPTFTATPTNTPCPYPNGVTNASLNGGGSSVTVGPGASVTVSYDWRVWNNPGRSALITVVSLDPARA